MFLIIIDYFIFIFLCYNYKFIKHYDIKYYIWYNILKESNKRNLYKIWKYGIFIITFILKISIYLESLATYEKKFEGKKLHLVVIYWLEFFQIFRSDFFLCIFYPFLFFLCMVNFNFQ